MRNSRSRQFGAVCLLVSLLLGATSSDSLVPEDIVVFNAPGAGTDSGQGTSAQSINKDGEITGHFVDAQSAVHGFVRHKDGTFTTFDAPRASKKATLGTFPRSINDHGEIAGYYQTDPDGMRHGFIRHKDGTFTTFDPPGSFGTIAQSINARGEVVGNYVADNAAHAYVRRRDRTFTAFQPPGSYNAAPNGINGHGETTGYYESESGVLRGFMGREDGTFATFDAPSASKNEGEGTFTTSINDNGEIAGYYNSGPYHGTHGFVRHKDGTFTQFDPPGSITDSGVHQDEDGYLVRPVTAPTSISEDGDIVGSYGDNKGVLHGFLRHRDGTFYTFEAPGASKNGNLGTFPMSINKDGEIAGYFYADPDGVLHSFVLRRSKVSATGAASEQNRSR